MRRRCGDAAAMRRCGGDLAAMLRALGDAPLRSARWGDTPLRSVRGRETLRFAPCAVAYGKDSMGDDVSLGALLLTSFQLDGDFVTKIDSRY